jgi:hypothetical protein
MRIGWRIPLPGPFYLGGTVWQSKRHRPRRPAFHGTLPGWECPHFHTRPDTAKACADREAGRRLRSLR